MTPEPLPSLHSVLLEYSQSSRDSSAPVQRTQPRNDVLGTGPNTESTVAKDIGHLDNVSKYCNMVKK